MALSRLQATGKARGNSPRSFSFASPPAVNNGILVLISTWNGLPTAVSDNRGNTYNLAIQLNNPSVTASVYYCSLIGTTGSPFTITVTGGTAIVAAAVEIGGIGSGLTLDRTATGAGSSTTPGSAATAALTHDEEILAGALGHNTNPGAITVAALSPAWVEEYEELDWSTYVGAEGDTRLLSSGATGQTPAANWTTTNSATWAAVIAAFTATPAAAAPTATFFIWGPL